MDEQPYRRNVLKASLAGMGVIALGGVSSGDQGEEPIENNTIRRLGDRFNESVEGRGELVCHDIYHLNNRNVVGSTKPDGEETPTVDELVDEHAVDTHPSFTGRHRGTAQLLEFEDDSELLVITEIPGERLESPAEAVGETVTTYLGGEKFVVEITDQMVEEQIGDR